MRWWITIRRDRRCGSREPSTRWWKVSGEVIIKFVEQFVILYIYTYTYTYTYGVFLRPVLRGQRALCSRGRLLDEHRTTGC